MGGPSFQWDAPFNGKHWSASLLIGSGVSVPLADSRFRLNVSGLFTREHHFGIEIWDQPPNMPTIKPIDVFLTMQSVASLMAARITTGEVRYRR